MFDTDKAVRRDGSPQNFGESLVSLLPGVDDAAAAETAPSIPRLAVASMTEVASGKGDILVVNREGKGSLMDAPAGKARKLKLGSLGGN